MNRRPLIAVAVVAGAALVISACSSSKKNGGSTGTNSGSGSGSASSSSSTSSDLGPPIINGGYTQKGGTVNVLVQSDFEHLDPVQNYVTNSGDVGKLIYRTLTTIDDTPGQPAKIVPDLADSLGKQSNGGKTWTYHLRSGLKFEDGSPITSADIKYAIERSFATDLYKDGATYMADWLVNPGNKYTGPYNDKSGKGLDSVQTPDASTIVLNFTSPQPDTDWAMSLYYDAPVPKAKDTKQQYDFHPVSSGPYKIESYARNRQLVLVRNPNWDPKTDPNRPALPDKFVVQMGISPSTISQRLIANSGADQSAVSIDNSSDLQAGDVGKLRAPDVKNRFVNGQTPCSFYEFYNTETIKDADVRKAISMAINRQAVITAMNGPLFGSIPQNYVSSTVRGYESANLGIPDTGDINAAKALLKGKQLPQNLRYAISAGRPVQHAVGVQVQSDLKKIGISITLKSIPTDSYYKTLRATPAQADMGLAGWCNDWFTLGSVVPPVLGPTSDGKSWGPSNFSRYYDPTISKQIQQLATSTDDPTTVDKKFNDLNNQILQQQWPLLPVQANLNPVLIGSKIHNAGVSTTWGLPDLNILGVSS